MLFAPAKSALRGLTWQIPYGQKIVLTAQGHAPRAGIGQAEGSLAAASDHGVAFSMANRKLGRIALCSKDGVVSADSEGAVSVRKKEPGVGGNVSMDRGLHGRTDADVAQ
jgi:hypothetical protein